MVFLLFFLSGMAGLIYEIVWSRQFGLLFGHTVNAAAVVLAAYFAGMAIGYLVAGRLAPRLKRPLIGYGVAELIVALWAVLTPFIMKGLANPALAQLINHPDPAVQLAVRGVVTFLTLLPATIALGATLPFIAQHLSPPGSPRPRLIALAYSANTLGAFTGVMLATFALILWLGITAGGNLAAAISAFCGLAAIALARRTAVAPAEAAPPGQEMALPAISPSWYVLAGLSGFGTLAYQVLVTRMFALTFHNSTYTFGGVVAVFLVALALGSLFTARFGNRFKPQPAAAWACLTGAIAVLGGVSLFQNITRLGYFEVRADWLTSIGIADPSTNFLVYILGALGLVAAVVLVPTFLLGMILPYCFAIAPQGGSGPGSAVGRFTAVNTVCATIGALCASFVMLPALGLWKSFMLLAVVYGIAGLIVLVKATPVRATYIAGPLLLIAVALGCYLINWPLAVTRGLELVYEKETPYGLITVLRGFKGQDLVLKQNNHYTLGAAFGSESELRQGNIPLLLHPGPKRVCFMGLATGITASAAVLDPGVEQAVSVELIPEVIEAAKLFSEYNAGVVTAEQSTVVANDARHYLYAADEKYNVIVSDLFVPWHSQTGYLYTLEHYRASRARLAEGGLFCQWLPLYQVGENELTMIADTFASVFPNTTVWRGELINEDAPLIALIGSEAPLVLDGAAIDARIKQLRTPFCGNDYGLNESADLLAFYVGRWNAPGKGSVLNTDDHPRVEFMAPLTHRRNEMLRRARLAGFYEDVLLTLPVGGIEYTPSEGEWDMEAGRQKQYRQLIDSL